MERDGNDGLEDLGDRFEISLLEEHVRQNEGDLDALRSLAYAYSAAGRLEEALAADRRLVALAPDRAELHYDLACSLARVGRRDDAFAELDRSVDLGFSSRDVVTSDPDLDSLHDDGRWAKLLARLEA
jgi:Flp pilus assembly protein TadD